MLHLRLAIVFKIYFSSSSVPLNQVTFGGYSEQLFYRLLFPVHVNIGALETAHKSREILPSPAA